MYIEDNPHTVNSEQVSEFLNVPHSAVLRLANTHRAELKSYKKTTKTKGRSGYVLYFDALNASKIISFSRAPSNAKNKVITALVDNAVISTVLSTVANLVDSIDTHDLPNDRFVYVAREATSGRYKIGISKNPVDRVKKLNTGNPEELILIHQYKASEPGYQSEVIAHALFAEYRIRGEWFDSSAKSRVENFAEIMGKSPVSTLLTQNGETK